MGMTSPDALVAQRDGAQQRLGRRAQPELSGVVPRAQGGRQSGHGFAEALAFPAEPVAHTPEPVAPERREPLVDPSLALALDRRQERVGRLTPPLTRLARTVAHAAEAISPDRRLRRV